MKTRVTDVGQAREAGGLENEWRKEYDIEIGT
jgi:hypothetical protein